MFGTHAPNHAPNHVHTRTQHYQNPFPPYTPLATISIEDVQLWIRQEPREALLCLDGKEKARKPVDPPPIVQVVIKNRSDPMQHFLQSPYLFMCASLWHPDSDEPWRSPPSKTLAGSVVSSLHRLKDIDNKDGAFFVFGDISVKTKGRYRLQFSLFDYQKTSGAALYLGSITSKPFVVDVSKDYKGLAESTYLSRAFSDQGVRLRLRKEPRTVIQKRSYAQVAPESAESENFLQPAKRMRVEPADEDEDHKDQKDQVCYSQEHVSYPREQVSYQQDLTSYAQSLPSNYSMTPTMSSAPYSLPHPHSQPHSQPMPSSLPSSLSSSNYTLSSSYNPPSYSTSSNHMPSQQMSSQQISSHQMSSQQMPSQQMSSHQMPSHQMPPQQMHSQQMHSQQMSQLSGSHMPEAQLPEAQLPEPQLPGQQWPNHQSFNGWYGQGQLP